MSLIHEALKKAGQVQTGAAQTGAAQAGGGRMVGVERSRGKTPAIPKRTLLLLILLLLSVAYFVYARFQGSPKPAASRAIPVPVVLTQQGASPMDQALAAYKRGDFAQAKEIFERLKSENPSEPIFWNNSGVIYKKMGQEASAIQAFEEALRLNPNYPECLNNLGLLNFQQGDWVKALEHLKKALSQDPNYVTVHLNLAIVFDKQGNHPEAKLHYERFVQLGVGEDAQIVEAARRRLGQL